MKNIYLTLTSCVRGIKKESGNSENNSRSEIGYWDLKKANVYGGFNQNKDFYHTQNQLDSIYKDITIEITDEFLNTGGAKGGETKIKKNINAKKYSEGADEFSDVTNNGTAGLKTRRQREINMFKNNIYDSKH